MIEPETGAPRVLVLATGVSDFGGIERSTTALVRSLAELYGPERVGVLTVWRSDPWKQPARLLFAGWPCRAGQGVGLTRRVRYALASLAMARRWRSNLVVVAAHPQLAPVAWAARALAGGRYVVWCYGLEVWGRVSLLVRTALRGADLVVAISRFTAGRMEANGLTRRVEVIPPCLSPELSLGRPQQKKSGAERPPKVLTVARLVPAESYKGVDTLLYSWVRVTYQVPAAQLVVVGDGADRGRLQDSAAVLGLGGTVTFAGAVSDEELAALYASSDLFALPARMRVGGHPEGEGFGLVFLEAGAMGLPVVSGRGGGVDEAVMHGVSGILVDPDDPEAVASAILDVLGDRSLARRLGEEGLARVRGEFSYESFRGRVRAAMDELTSRREDVPCAAS